MPVNKKNILLFIVAVLVTVLLAEGLLRLTGTKPGWVNNYDGFNRVDSLIVYQNFTTDEAGIYKFSPWVTDSMLKYFDCQQRQITNAELKKVLNEEDYVSYIYQNYCKQTQEPAFSFYWKYIEWYYGQADSNCLSNTRQRLINNEINTDAVWREAFAEYFSRPFNQDGFRSIPFKNYNTRQLKVLIIGDSFVYGMDAHPFQNSFTDLLLSKGYLVYAAGIPGTDPAQYAAIAQEYIPLLKPDVVINCFYAGNDFMKYEREPDAARPHEHLTNAGLLASNPLGKYLSANEAYRFYLSLCTFPDERNLWFDKLCARSAIGTLVWNALYKNKLVSHLPNLTYSSTDKIPPAAVNKITRNYTGRLIDICRQNRVPLINAVIPFREQLTADTAVMNYLFENNFCSPQGLNGKDDFYRDKVHFNNTGSVKFAGFIDTLLQPYVKAKALLLPEQK